MSESSFNSVSGDDKFVRSAGGQLAKFTLYAMAGLALVIYLLSVLAGEARQHDLRQRHRFREQCHHHRAQGGATATGCQSGH